MDETLFEILGKFRSCFSREATYYWFFLVMLGLIVRGDHYGVSSIVRWLRLAPGYYWPILNFFNSNGWELEGVLLCWWNYCLHDAACLKIQERLVLIGDHTNQPKDGRKMPGVVTIHQDSETSSKPSYYRGHVWAFIALVMESTKKYFAVPLKQRNNQDCQSMSTRMVYNALDIAIKMDCPIYLILDAYFSVGPVFLVAAGVYSVAFRVPFVHIITRAKKSVVAYQDPLPEDNPPGKRGPKKKYGKRLKLMELFKDKANEFVEATCFVYGHNETAKILCLDLIWKPIKMKIRFVLAITSRGSIILMSSDLNLSAVQILELYCRRASIENMFSVLKNLIGGLRYHFWCKLIEKSSRRPKKNKSSKESSHSVPAKIVENKVMAIEMFVNMSAILVGILQILALRFPEKIWQNNILWLRTRSNSIPSEYIVKGVLTQTILMNLSKVNAHAIYALIRSRQSKTNNIEELKKVAQL
jgi:hypothetical protein